MPEPAQTAEAGWHLDVDCDHGGRWTSLIDPSGREWLWSRPDPARHRAAPGAAFIDVGGVEECYPTINGVPDHGDVWTRKWQPAGDTQEAVHSGDSELVRSRYVAKDRVQVDYRLTGPPGMGFLWAAHMLLTPTDGLQLDAPASWPAVTWPAGGRRADRWPHVANIADFDVLGADDGSAVFCLLPELDTIGVRIGNDRLRMRLHCADQPVSIGIWRNLGGFAADGGPAYRSVGVEPILGRHSNLAATTASERAQLADTGETRWQLTIDNSGVSSGSA